MKYIGEYDINDLGIEHAQYFQGFGTTFTPYSHSAVGTGQDFREALDDCLEQIAADGFDVAELEERLCDEFKVETLDELPTTPSVESYLMEENPNDWADETGEFDGTDCELYYYVGIRWNEAPEIVNLDAMDFDELAAFAADTSRPELLRTYADVRARAMNSRQGGRIRNALRLETICECIYNALPDNLRW